MLPRLLKPPSCLLCCLILASSFEATSDPIECEPAVGTQLEILVIGFSCQIPFRIMHIDRGQALPDGTCVERWLLIPERRRFLNRPLELCNCRLWIAFAA